MLEPCKAANIEPPTLLPFFHFYSSSDWDKKRIESEWKNISTLEILFKLLESPLLFWRKILSMKTPCGSLRFKNLQKVVMYLLSLLFSNVAMERLFSSLKNIKTDIRNSLSSESLGACLQSQSGFNRAGQTDNPHLRKRLKMVKAIATSEECRGMSIMKP